MSFPYQEAGEPVSSVLQGMSSFEVNLNQNTLPNQSTQSTSSASSTAPCTPKSLPVKRRRGRPPKTIDSTDGHPSPAASSSAAVLKQGSPKASVSFMKVSPLRKSSIGSSSPLSAMKVHPSPKGGKLLRLNENNDSSPTIGKKVRKTSLSKTIDDKTKMMSFDEFSQIHDSIHSLTNSRELLPIQSSSVISSSFLRNEPTVVNPNMLLSSPIKSDQGFIKQNFKPQGKDTLLYETPSVIRPKKFSNFLLSSSPRSPEPSSCFSSADHTSSPLYNGYYGNFPSSSPANIFKNSTKKAQSSNITPVKTQSMMLDFNKRIEQLNQMENPKNPSNSPIIEPIVFKSKSTLPTVSIKKPKVSKNSVLPDMETFKFSININENGQAVLLKTKTVLPVSNVKIKKENLISLADSSPAVSTNSRNNNNSSTNTTSNSNASTVPQTPKFLTPKFQLNQESLSSPNPLLTPGRFANNIMEPSRFDFDLLQTTLSPPPSSAGFSSNANIHSSSLGLCPTGQTFQNYMLISSGHNNSSSAAASQTAVTSTIDIPIISITPTTTIDVPTRNGRTRKATKSTTGTSKASSVSKKKKKEKKISQKADLEIRMNDERMKFDARKALFDLVKNQTSTTAGSSSGSVI